MGRFFFILNEKKKRRISDQEERNGVIIGVGTLIVDEGSIQKKDQHLIEVHVSPLFGRANIL